MEGRLKLDQWDDKNTGQKVSKLRVVMESFQFIGGPKSGEGGPMPSASASASASPSSAPGSSAPPRAPRPASPPPSDSSEGPPSDVDDVPF